MKQLIKLSLLLLAFMLPAIAIAHDFEVDGIYYNINGNEATVTYRGTDYYQYSNEYSGNVIIPASVTYNGKTYSVTAIGGSAFDECSGLTNVTIPNSVTTIGSWAFHGCSGLTSVNIPNSVTTIDNYAFSFCTGLTSLTIGNSVITIGEEAFRGCTALTSLNIPNSVTAIGGWAFFGCSSLTSVIVESGNPKYDSRNNCNAIIETVTNTLIIGCMNTTIPNSVTAIGDYAFYECSGLTSITIPNSVTTIDNYAFSYCTGLTSLTIGNSVITIGGSAFECCTGLTSVTIPNSVTTIEGWAFFGCSSLTSVTFGNSINYIGADVFNGCPLTYVNITDLNAWCSIESFIDGVCLDDHDCSPYNPLYFTHRLFLNGTEITDLIIPNSVTFIGHYVFNVCTELTSVTIPNSVKSIGYGSFYGCTGLTSVTIPNSVTFIGWDAFHDCSGLTNVTIGNSVDYIGECAFLRCTSLNSITCLATIPPTLDSFYGNGYMFDDYTYSSATLKVPQSSISAYQAADYWKNFTNIQGLADVFKVDGIYYHTVNYSTATVIPNPEGEGYYQGDVVIPDSITTQDLQFRVTGIENGAFDGCDELNSVVIGDAVETIGEEAFQGCTGLTSVTIGNGVTSIGQRAFNYCNALQTVTCLGTEPPVMANSNCFSSAAYRKATLKVHRNYIDTYTATDYWYKFENIEGFGSIGLGDANCDGEINIADVTTLIDQLLGKNSGSEFYFESADLNGNGHLDIGDVTTLIDLLLWSH